MILPKFICVGIFCLLVLGRTAVVAQAVYEFDSSIEVVENGFALKMPWAGGINSGQYQAIDLNRDGQNDLVIFDRTSIKVNTYIWTDGGYLYDPDYEALFPDDLNAWLVIVDFNCDGVEDLISSSVFGMKVYIGKLQDEKLQWELLMDPVTTEGFSSQVNLQVNSADIPAIVDIDKDGDLDIFVFNFARGGTIEYHQNFSMENEGECGLLFKRVESVWGDFEECSCGVYALGISCSEMTGRAELSPAKTMHAGGKTLLLLDYDGDGDKDMLFGDEECNNLAYFENSEINEVADFNSYRVAFPDSNPSSYPFPAAYLIDIDQDGLQDLIIAPNLATPAGRQIDFSKSSSMYKNVGTAAKFEFQLVAEDFLQNEMIDVGYDAAIALNDIDNDGKTDFLVGNGGNNSTASLTYYKNTGTVNAPAFTLHSADFLNLSAAKLDNILPGFADLNGDGEDDFYFTGTAEDGTTSLYYVIRENGTFAENSLQVATDISLGAGDNMAMNLLSNNDFADLLIFRSSGRVEYYENMGSNGSIAFELVEDNFAGFTDKFENRNLTPAIYDVDADGKNELVISNGKGQLYIISDYFNHQSGLAEAETVSIKNIRWNNTYHKSFGFESKIAFGPLFRGELPSMLIGSRQGGVYLLRNKNGSVNPGEDGLTLTCFPVPTDDILNVEVSHNSRIVLYNTMGKIVWEGREQAGGIKYSYNTSTLASGVYFVTAISESGARSTRKIIVL